MKRDDKENYDFSPWRRFRQTMLVVAVLMAIAAMYALAAMLL